MSPLLVSITIGIIAGLVLGAAYFGGLWITLNQIQNLRRPYWVLGASFLLRTALVLGGFYLLLMVHIAALVAGLVAFTIVRLVSVGWQAGKPEQAKGGG